MSASFSFGRWRMSGGVRSRVVAGGIVAVVVSLLFAGPAIAQPATELPVTYSFAAAATTAAAHPDTSPPGANDWSCRPTSAHPRPVVLLHGTVLNMTIDWQALSPLLKNNGYCVYAFNYGQEVDVSRLNLFPGSAKAGGTDAVPASAGQLAEFIQRVESATGSPQVDIVGHSQGGMMARYYLKFLGGASSVDHLIGLAPSNHGTTLLGSSRLPGVAQTLSMGFGQSVTDQVAGSPLLTDLNAGDETVPGVSHTVIETIHDEVVTPHTSAFLAGPDVTNISLQSQCPQNFSDHVSITYDRLALSHTLHALDPTYPIASCDPSVPLIGG